MGVQSPRKSDDGDGGKYTPPSKRLGASGSDGTIVVAAPVRSVGVPIQYPQLTEGNYQLWAAKMKIILKPMGVWSSITGEDVDEAKDQGAMAAISQSVPDDVMMSIVEYESAKEAWDAIRTMRIGDERVVQARISHLTRRFERLTMEDGEEVGAFGRRLTALVGEIRALGENLQEHAVVKRLFAAVPDRFLPIIGTIEQWGDVKKMSVAEAIGRLRAFEENESGRRQDRSDDGEKLMLVSRAELEALIQKEKKKGEGSSSSGKDGDGCGGGRGRDDDRKKVRGKFDKSKITCFECGEKGHFKSECEAWKKEKALLVAADVDDEPALLMAMACELAPEVDGTAGVLEPTEMEAEGGHALGGEFFKPSDASMEVETAKAGVARLRGELAAANAKLHALSDEYMTQAEELVHAREEKAKFLEMQRVICDENGRLRDLVVHAAEAPIQVKTAPAAGSAATTLPTPVVRAAVTTPPSAAVTLGVKKPGVKIKENKGCRSDMLLTDEGSELVEKSKNFVMLNEENVKALLSMDGSADAWWLDSGASNHMTGSRCKFKEIDESIRGHVKLGDGSIALIKGKGSVIVECKSGEQLHLTKVYFVPSLPSNIISLGKLAEDGNRVVLDGTFLWVRGRSGKMQMKVKRSPNRLYMVRLKTVVGAAHVSSRKRSPEAFRLQQQQLEMEMPSVNGGVTHRGVRSGASGSNKVRE
ncbi:hypothetical protein VPH35_140971 [Triticum aestivum]